jgi:hypothetical protein
MWSIYFQKAGQNNLKQLVKKVGGVFKHPVN